METSRSTHHRYAPPAPPELETCVTCGQEIDSPFCASCGERRASDRTYSVWEFIKDHVIESVANLDGRAIRTFKALAIKPGELTREFMRGSRLPYLAPLQLFLLCNLAFFVWAAWSQQRIFDTQLVVHTGGQPYSVVAKRLVAARLAATHEDSTVYMARFDAVGAAQARSLVIAMVPMFAVVIGIATLRLRRPQVPVVQHVVFVLHFFAFWFLSFIVAQYLINYPLNALLTALKVTPGEYGYDAEISLALLTIVCIYLGLAMRRAYGLGRVRAVLTAPVLGLALFAVLQTYRGLLFFVTFYST